jgi:hypothetical protein
MEHVEQSMAKTAKTVRRIGRPAKPAADRMGQVAVRFPPDMVAAIDRLRAGRLDAPDRSTVIRELVAEALSARGKGKRT